MRFIHTSDWQIAKAFRFVDDETNAVLRAERLEVINRLGKLAQEHKAGAVLVAGDVYDVGAPSDRMLHQPMERMRSFPSVAWHLIPGNHDAHVPNGPWERLLRSGLPENVVVHTTPEPVQLRDKSAWILPSVLERRHAAGDPTESMATNGTPEGAIRIGLAHGSIRSFGSTEGSTHNLIALNRAERNRLDYLALGDWHGALQVGERTWYSGTPEPDGFDRGGDGGGEALLVEVEGPGALPVVTRYTVGRFRWQSENAVLMTTGDVDILEARLRSFHSDLNSTLLRLKVEGVLSLAGREVFHQRIRLGLGSALRSLLINEEALRMEPSPADLEAIDHVGFVRAAADRLMALAADPASGQHELAAAALQRLYLLHMRHEGGTR